MFELICCLGLRTPLRCNLSLVCSSSFGLLQLFLARKPLFLLLLRLSSHFLR